MAELFDWRGPYLIPLVLMLTARIVAWWYIRVASEDAYITYRYARSLATGHGLVFNPNERVMGFSSPLWTVWNALGYLVTRDPVVWSRAWSILADAVTLIAMGRLISRHASRVSAFCFTFFFAVWPYFAALAVSGMEISTMLALAALSAALVEARHPLAGGTLGALALTRPEGLLIAAMIALGARTRDRLIAASIVAIALTALALYFGTVIPQSVAAKARIYGTPGPLAGVFWWEWLLPFLLGHWPKLTDTVLLTVMTIVVAPGFVVGLRQLWGARRSALARLVAAMLLIWLGYSMLGVAYFWWYLAAPLLGVIAAASIGFPRLIQGPGIFVTAATMVLGMWSIALNLYAGRSDEERLSFGRAGQYLAEHASPGDKVLLEPIGMIGYMAPVVVLDETGLVSPQVTERRMRGAGWYSDIVGTERPQWLVLRYGVMRTGRAWAGTGAPFRDMAERDSLLGRYALEPPREQPPGDAELVVLHRAR
jgi:hypothetical protein